MNLLENQAVFFLDLCCNAIIYTNSSQAFFESFFILNFSNNMLLNFWAENTFFFFFPCLAVSHGFNTLKGLPQAPFSHVGCTLK